MASVTDGRHTVTGGDSAWTPRRMLKAALRRRRHRIAGQVAADAVAWTVALSAATLLRFDFHLSSERFSGLLVLIPIAVLFQLVAGLACGLYTGRSRFGSFDEVVSMVRSVTITAAVLAIVNPIADPRLVPASVPVIGGVMALALLAGIRYCWRLSIERRRRPSEDGCHRLLIFGAGDGAAQVIPALLRNPTSVYLPVGLIDDDPAKRKLRIMGMPVLGDRTELVKAATESRADSILIAVPSAGHELVAELSELAREAELAAKVLPPVWDLFEGRVDAGDIRDVTEADLLGRHEIDTDLASIAGYLTGKRVLVTGAGGSIGSELCRQIYRFAPAELIMLDRDESALHAVQLSHRGPGPARHARPGARRHPRPRPHASRCSGPPARGRLPRRRPQAPARCSSSTRRGGEDQRLGHADGARRRPRSRRGALRQHLDRQGRRSDQRPRLHQAGHRAAHRLDGRHHPPGVFLSVRFGNVLGSRGSVLTAFRAQIEAGGPITVTDPDVTRYFMTVEEAVQLVIQAGAIGHDGEALVLDMGDPVRIADVARRLAARSDRPIDIVYTGLRPGEKLHEVLLGADEVDERPAHPLISHVPVPPLDPVLARAIDALALPGELIASLASLAADARPAGNRLRTAAG